MPKKKKVLAKRKKVVRKKPSVKSVKAVKKQPKTEVLHSQKWFKWGESYTSLMLGIIVVIIGVLFVASFFKTKHTQDVTSTSTSTVGQQQPTIAPSPTQQTYTVQLGDSLWSISQKIYQTGYNWVAIAKANNLSDPNSIDAGMKLILPAINPSTTPTPTAMTGFPTQSQTTNPQAITGNSYTVVKGDTLWDIAVRAYSDGYKWVDIAKANNLTNPNLIFSGNVFTLPR